MRSCAYIVRKTRRNMKFANVRQHVQSCLAGEEKFAPAYVVTGDDDFLVASAVRTFKKIVNPDYADFNLSVLSGDGAVYAAIDSAYTFPVFDDVKAVVLYVDSLDEGEKSALDKYFSEPSETTVLVIVASEDAAKSVKSKKAQIVDCSKLAGDELFAMIKEICSAPPSIDIERSALSEIADRTQGNMSRIASEITKLKAYSQNVITKQDVVDMVSADIDFQIYELANAVSEKNADKALEVLDVFFKNGIRGVTVINRLYDKYRNMLHAELNKSMPNEELGKLLGMKSGAVYFLRKTSSNYSQVRLKKCVDYLHSLQCDVLFGKRNDQSAIHEAILQLLTI